MPVAGDYPPLAGRAECTYAFPRGVVRIWQEVALAREDASPCLRWARLKSAAISRNCGGLNPLPAKRNHCAVADVATTAGITGGLGSVQLTAGGDIRPPRADERSACVSKRQDCCILSGATVE